MIAACCLTCSTLRLAKQEVELSSLQLEVSQGHQDLARKVRGEGGGGSSILRGGGDQASKGSGHSCRFGCVHVGRYASRVQLGEVSLHLFACQQQSNAALRYTFLHMQKHPCSPGAGITSFLAAQVLTALNLACLHCTHIGKQ